MSSSMDRITVGCDSGNYSNAGGRDYDSYNWQPACTDPDRIAVGNGGSSVDQRVSDVYARSETSGSGWGDVAWNCLMYVVGASNETYADHKAKVEADKALAFAHIEISIERPAEDLRPDIYGPNTTIV